MPTILDLAGLNSDDLDEVMDGRSMKEVLLHDNPEEETFDFRQYFLNEYYSVGTYFNNHGSIWQDGKTTSELCQTGPQSKSGPIGPDPDVTEDDCVESEGIGDGNCWFVDSKHSNSWRQLRIMNDTMNWNYVEYDPAWKFAN